MSYADFEFYTTEYLGDVIAEADFPRLALRASAFLDYYTRGKAAKTPDLSALKMACCAVAERYVLIDAADKSANAAITAAEGQGLQSQTVGSWSRTYRVGGETAAAALDAAGGARASLAAAAMMYLSGTGLIYRGCCG